ncbi:di-trans,poly-cis-decaprenylcistransferase [Candidatus Gottesmanbacteria bacterium]|nr:di-trans,poly-cis-decaprenylcistransferase [Candidatus Gottesmanbacteria bacterium]MBI5452362.1 di-trans,poly-cis-decaprenylcistransferase [Candidatus Gottesmanbacteria bacterium]
MMKNINIPKHIAIIMDGNRRWAKEKGLSSFAGHKKGEEAIEPIVDTAIELGIPYLTFWAFSTENWHREKKEVSFLLNLYRENLDKKVDSFHRKNVRVNVIGNISMFPKDIQEKTKQWMEKTKNNKKITVNIALSYGGRDEIIRAINKLSNQQIIQLTIKQFSNYLDTASQPDPDLLIRTGGEKRLSGFLLWQMEYTELYFTDIYWPDFTAEEFKKAIDEYCYRQRRFGR